MNNTTISLLSVTFFFLMLTASNSSSNIIAVNKNLSDGETIISGDATFELGFFSPGSPRNRYLGIWYKNTTPSVVVWVANRETPLIDTSGIVKLDSQGTLSLVNGSGITIWSSNSSTTGTSVNPIAQLLDTGNLVIMNENQTNKNHLIWQSFDYPGDTYLPGMKMGKNFKTRREMYLTSWRSADDPSPGVYTLRFSMVKGKYQQQYIRKNSVIQSRIAPINGITWAGRPNYKPNPSYIATYDIILNEDEMYFVFSFKSTFLLIKSIITPGGKHEVWHLNRKTGKWTQDLSFPSDKCDGYGVCGPYGICSTDTYNICGCFKGFEPKNPQEMPQDNWSSGCRRTRSLDCSAEEGFQKFSSLKLPDTQNAMYDSHMSLHECEVACKSNCSCTAYANPNMTEGAAGCLLWFGELIDLRVYSQNGQDLYVRLAASELLVKVLETEHNSSNKKGNIELTVFRLSTISRATNKFSIENILGQGGFGPVYKGVLEEGQEIAVKRLSKSSKQGLDEFENEVICIAKLQHRNLVKLLGYCIKGEETLLVYEYMPNKSLDWFIFDDLRKSLLDWPQRFHIIQGIARGLLYLHQDSRLRVVHRDLKASNILLDHEMNPKISDFGLARMLEGKESEAKTKKVVGTLGYISPEYAGKGLFSVKSDIFSYGVLVLEIVSGKKNRAWRLYREGKSIELVDASLGESWSTHEVLRSIHIGLLCVQQQVEDRPTTAVVVAMLSGEGSLPPPKKPAFFVQGSVSDLVSVRPSSINGVTLSQIDGR
ncbi:putative protein kinase RLK-Pelle-DLSV family [Helianthus annuus]|nr:putative protein kinase RLK-Pelle-DLSV family [Helianthus annuus]